MSGRGKGKSVAAPQEPSAAEVARSSATSSAAADGQKESRRRRRRGDGSLEERIGYRFTDATMLDSALSHISALKGARNRAGSYQRLEFLGDHVLGLVISDMLFRAFPKADEGELSRRLADLVRKETCAEIARAIDLGTAIRLGASEANAGGRDPAGDPRRCLRGADRRRLSGRRVFRRRGVGRTAMGSAHAHDRAAAAGS